MSWIRRARRAFTLIELLVVIAIIMAIMGMALPNFIAMTKERKWTTAFTDVQGFVWRARALATNARKDMSVEFSCQGDNGTWMWVESESNLIERLPDLDWLQQNLGGGGAIAWILFGEWYSSGGTFTWVSPWYANMTINSANTRPQDYGDNARQSEIVKMGGGLTVDDSSSASPDFINWDAPPQPVSLSRPGYGSDGYKDLRIATNGALVQTREPVICVRQIDGTELRKWRVIRCTGRLVPAR